MFLISSCGFPGPIITYNKTTSEDKNDSARYVEKECDYFCFDYDKDYKCHKYRSIIYDTLTNKIIQIDIFRATQICYDGRKKIKARTVQYDKNGKIKRKIKSHKQTYGRTGRIILYKEIEYLDNGQKKITIEKGTLNNPEKLKKVRYKGSKY